jgi:hypothetical protein
MKCVIVCALLIALSPCAPARTATPAERKTCEEKIRRKLDAIDARMRAGYSGEQGEALKERRRKLEKELAGCRTVA